MHTQIHLPCTDKSLFGSINHPKAQPQIARQQPDSIAHASASTTPCLLLTAGGSLVKRNQTQLGHTETDPTAKPVEQVLGTPTSPGCGVNSHVCGGKMPFSIVNVTQREPANCSQPPAAVLCHNHSAKVALRATATCQKFLACRGRACWRKPALMWV